MTDLHTLGSFDSNLLKTLSLLHGPNNGLDKLFDLLVETADVSVLLCRLLVHLHSLDSAVVFGWQGVEDEVGVLVDSNQVAGLQLLVIHQADERKENGLPSRCLNDSRFSNSCSIKVNVGTFFRRFGSGIEIEQFDNVTDEVR